jgi:hypothetical protein
MEACPMSPGQSSVEEQPASNLPSLVATPTFVGSSYASPRIGRITSTTFQ